MEIAILLLFPNSLSHFCSMSTQWQLQVAFSNVISFGNLGIESADYSLYGSTVLDACEFY